VSNEIITIMIEQRTSEVGWRVAVYIGDKLEQASPVVGDRAQALRMAAKVNQEIKRRFPMWNIQRMRA
jgi:hypothetical protein